MSLFCRSTICGLPVYYYVTSSFYFISGNIFTPFDKVHCESDRRQEKGGSSGPTDCVPRLYFRKVLVSTFPI